MYDYANIPVVSKIFSFNGPPKAISTKLGTHNLTIIL